MALKNINLAIHQGEFVSIIGHNGSGKSTLAKLFNALLLPTRGDVIVGGKNTKDGEKLWAIRQQVGMVFQNPDNQIVATTVEEDVAFGPENLGLSPDEIGRRVVKPWPWWGWRSTATGPHTLYRGGKSSGWPSLASSPCVRPASSWTNQPPCWTLSDAGRCWRQSNGSTVKKGSPWSWSPISWKRRSLPSGCSSWPKGASSCQDLRRKSSVRGEQMRQLRLDVPPDRPAGVGTSPKRHPRTPGDLQYQ